MTYNIKEFKTFGPEFPTKLAVLKINTTDDLIKASRDAAGYRTLVDTPGMERPAMERAVSMARLTRVEGITPPVAELLVFGGMDTIEKVRAEKPERLVRKLTDVNGTHKLVTTLPKVSEVEAWMAPGRVAETPTVR